MKYLKCLKNEQNCDKIKKLILRKTTMKGSDANECCKWNWHFASPRNAEK